MNAFIPAIVVAGETELGAAEETIATGNGRVSLSHPHVDFSCMGGGGGGADAGVKEAFTKRDILVVDCCGGGCEDDGVVVVVVVVV